MSNPTPIVAGWASVKRPKLIRKAGAEETTIRTVSMNDSSSKTGTDTQDVVVVDETWKETSIERNTVDCLDCLVPFRMLGEFSLAFGYVEMCIRKKEEVAYELCTNWNSRRESNYQLVFTDQVGAQRPNESRRMMREKGRELGEGWGRGCGGVSTDVFVGGWGSSAEPSLNVWSLRHDARIPPIGGHLASQEAMAIVLRKRLDFGPNYTKLGKSWRPGITNIKKSDSDECWWCEIGKRQTREHLFKECLHWKVEITELWRRVSKDVGWRNHRWKPISSLFNEKKATGAILEFLDKTEWAR
ncbi:hypothetical protein FPQ18DRAFT_300497 [Pyronema domesticum]|nr:hypothetical protein FPQ18DRAFT_300497 [Pyronema domesticum]